ncbi:MAG: hypothetical protein AB7G12_08495 [Thermoanaerobaculia bacterium]
MNRYARIMQWIGVLALLCWLVTLAQGFAVDTGRPTLAWHTIGALLAAALTLLARTWTISFLLLSSGSSSDAATPGSARRRTVALAASALSLVWLAVAFLFAGRLLWHRLAPSVHAAIGAGIVVSHVAALWLERRALGDVDESAAAPDSAA